MFEMCRALATDLDDSKVAIQQLQFGFRNKNKTKIKQLQSRCRAHLL